MLTIQFLFANSEIELQKLLDNLSVYCDKWKNNHSVIFALNIETLY